MTFSENLKKARESAGLGQKELAEITKLSAVTISRYENAGREPTVSDLITIAKALGVTVAFLVGESEDSPGESKSDVTSLGPKEGQRFKSSRFNIDYEYICERGHLASKEQLDDVERYLKRSLREVEKLREMPQHCERPAKDGIVA